MRYLDSWTYVCSYSAATLRNCATTVFHSSKYRRTTGEMVGQQRDIAEDKQRDTSPIFLQHLLLATLHIAKHTTTTEPFAGFRYGLLLFKSVQGNGTKLSGE